MSLKQLLTSFVSKNLNWLIHGSQLAAIVFFLETGSWELISRAAATTLIASPFLFGIPIAENYFLAKDGSLKSFYCFVFQRWQGMVLLAVAIFLLACYGKVGLPLAILIGVAAGLFAPLHGALSGSFFSRMIKRGLM